MLAVIGLAMRRQGLLGRRAVAAVAVALAIATAAGPAAYSVATAGRALDGNNVTAGPASASGFGGPGGGGGMGGQGSVSTETIAWLQAHQGSAKYLVAATGSQTTAGIIIASGEPVVTIGGFNGGDPAPTVAQLEAMVKAGELKYVLVGGGMGGGPGGSSSSPSCRRGCRSTAAAVIRAARRAATGRCTRSPRERGRCLRASRPRRQRRVGR